MVGERHGELFDPAAAGAVGCETGVSGVARDRFSIDDPSGGAWNHAVASDGLGQEEDVAQIVFEAEVPIVSDHFGGWFADVAAGLIDEDVELVVERVEGGGGRLEAGVVAHVEGEGDVLPRRSGGSVTKKKAPVMGAFFVKK